MKLVELKQKTCALLDEIAGSKSAQEYEDKFNRLMDIGQKEICMVYPLIRTQNMTIKTDKRAYLPEDLTKILGVYDPSGQSVSYRLLGDQMLLGDTDADKVTLEYEAWPRAIDDAAADTMTLSLDDIACDVLCYYVASQCLLHENDQRPFQNLYTLYQQKMQNLALLHTQRRTGAAAAKVKGGVRL